jgi:hypothetical protein
MESNMEVPQKAKNKTYLRILLDLSWDIHEGFNVTIQ